MFATALTLLAALPALPAAAAASPTPADPLLAARGQAVSTGKPVVVDALTTETSTTEALPDGTFVNTTSPLPTRVRKDGAWTPVDATLIADGDGGYAPKATPNAVTLSGGGNGPLVTLTHADGPGMTLTLPFTLPAPRVSGDTALYPSVLPGVDLSVSVTDQGGFSDILIVHNAAAAADPQLRKLTLAADTRGLTLATTDAGDVRATAADGDLVYTSPQPLMWDSGTTPVMLQELGSAPDPAAGLTSSVEGPGAGATTEPVAVAVGSDTLTLTPDAGVLTGPGTTYPVFIDPYTNPVSSTAGHYTEVYSSSTCENSPQYDKAQTNGQGVGYQRWGGACGVGLERSYWAINTGGLHPAFVVDSASVKISTTYAASWSCSQNQPVTLHTTNAISSSTDWLSRPGAHDTAFPPVTDTVPSGANSSSSCSNSTATFNVTAAVQKIADQDGDGYDADGTFGAASNTWTIGLYGNESQTSGNDDYLRMSTTLTLTTKFDIPPDVPDNLHMTPAATGASAPCTTSGVGWIGATTYSDAGSNITLHSTVATQMSGEHVKAHYYVWDRTIDPDGDGNGAAVSTPDSSFLASGADAPMGIGATLKDGHQYGWDVYAEDDSSQGLTSAKSEHCWFTTDFTAPQSPDVTTNPSFPPVGSGPVDADKVVYAGVGKTTDFTVAAADNAAADTTCDPGPCRSSGMDHFLWQLDSAPTAADGTSAGITGTDAQGRSTGKVTVPITDWGVHTLYVAAVDKAGNISTNVSGYTYTVPWNPATKIKPGDISGDGVPDLLATTKTGDLNMIPGNLDPAQNTGAVQSGPVTGTPPPVTGPVTVATAADSPDHTGWNNYLIAHRGNLHGSDVDDLFAYNKVSKQLYVVKNDLDPVDDASFPRIPYSTFGGFIGERFDVVTKDACAPSDVVADDTRCRGTDYNSQSWNVSQLITPGNVFGNSYDYSAVITVENKELWIYQSDGGYHLKNPLLLGDGDWTGQTLIAAGTFKGSPVLWSRDNTTGALYSYPLAVDGDTLVPALLHPTVHTALGLTLAPAAFPVVASPGDVNSPVATGTNGGGPDGIPDLYTVDTSGQLIEYNYRQSPVLTSPPTYSFAAPVPLGSVTDTASHWWKLAEGTGGTTADSTGTLGTTLTGAYNWTTDAARGKVLNLSGTTGYGAASGPAVDTSKSFTVSAWVKLNSASANSTFVSQSGTINNGFQLYYSSGAQAWAFGRWSTDTTGAVWRAAYGSKPVTGQWTYLVGVYDSTAKEVRLYVNGRLSATRDWTYAPWNATGPLQIGRKIAAGTYAEYTNAALSSIRVYPTALPPADAAGTGDSPKVVQLD
ncbi:LamG domain-containing protein [Streptomyces sp. NBC_00510]